MRRFRWVLVAGPLLFVAVISGTGGMGARGAQGLGERATATADACRALAETWREKGAVPAEIGIEGRMRPVLDLSRHGVVAGTDVREALQAVFDEAKALPAPILFLPPTGPYERYRRSGRVILAAAGAEFCGYGARVVATEELDIGFGLAADGIGLYGVTLEAPASAFSEWAESWRATSGRSVPEKYPPDSGGPYRSWSSHILVQGVEDLVLRDVTLLGARRGGVMLYGASNALIEGACVFRTHSDGIHVVHGSEHVTVRHNRIFESGDDCISVVTYDRDKYPRTVSDVLIEGNICHGSRTRGLTVIGGDDVSIIGNEVRDTLTAGILLYPSPTYNTYPVRNVTVEGNRLDGVGLRRDGCNNCGDIVVNDSGQAQVEDIKIGENAVQSRPQGSPIRPEAACDVGGD